MTDFKLGIVRLGRVAGKVSGAASGRGAGAGSGPRGPAGGTGPGGCAGGRPVACPRGAPFRRRGLGLGRCAAAREEAGTAGTAAPFRGGALAAAETGVRAAPSPRGLVALGAGFTRPAVATSGRAPVGPAARPLSAALPPRPALARWRLGLCTGGH